MRRILLAFRAFFAILFGSAAAEQARRIFTAGAAIEPTPTPQPKKPPTREPPARSDAITLLAALQREARFVDFV